MVSNVRFEAARVAVNCPVEPQRSLRVLVVAWSNQGGGAANATHRIFRALEQYGPTHGIDPYLRTIVGSSQSPRHVVGPPSKSAAHAWAERWIWFLRRGPGHFLLRRPSSLPTTADIPTGLGREIEAFQADLVVLHWLGNRTLSIQEVGRLSAPVLWTLSDEWLFSGTRHYTSDSSRRDIKLFLADRWTDFLKGQYLRQIPVLSKSAKLASAAKESHLGQRMRVQVLPNPIDTQFWQPSTKRSEGKRFLTFCFGYSGTAAGHRKGAHHVRALLSSIAALNRNSRCPRQIRLDQFGDADVFSDSGGPSSTDFQSVRHGILGAKSLRELYLQSTFLLVLSEHDNTPNIVLEGMAVGAVVVVREGSGADDLVSDGETGFVWSDGESVSALASRLLEVTEDELLSISRKATNLIAREFAEEEWARKMASIVHLLVSAGETR